MKRMKLSELHDLKTALTTTQGIWCYMAEHGCDKETAIEVLSLPTDMGNDCPMCEWADSNFFECKDCQAVMRWSQTDEDDCVGCENTQAEYYLWESFVRWEDSPVDARRMAQKIADLASRALNRREILHRRF